MKNMLTMRYHESKRVYINFKQHFNMHNIFCLEQLGLNLLIFKHLRDCNFRLINKGSELK